MQEINKREEFVEEVIKKSKIVGTGLVAEAKQLVFLFFLLRIIQK